MADRTFVGSLLHYAHYFCHISQMLRRSGWPGSGVGNDTGERWIKTRARVPTSTAAWGWRTWRKHHREVLDATFSRESWHVKERTRTFFAERPGVNLTLSLPLSFDAEDWRGDIGEVGNRESASDCNQAAIVSSSAFAGRSMVGTDCDATAGDTSRELFSRRLACVDGDGLEDVLNADT